MKLEQTPRWIHFFQLVNEKQDTELAKHSDGCWKYSVSATFVARVEAAHPNDDDSDLPGFGHMGWSKVKLKLVSVSATKTTLNPIVVEP